MSDITKDLYAVLHKELTRPYPKQAVEAVMALRGQGGYTMSANPPARALLAILVTECGEIREMLPNDLLARIDGVMVEAQQWWRTTFTPHPFATSLYNSLNRT